MADPNRPHPTNDPLARRFRNGPPYPPRRPPGGLRDERRRPVRTRRRSFAEARSLHATSTARIGEIDAAIEALVDQRLGCLDVLVDCREQLRPHWSTRHNRRRNSVDEAPFPAALPSAEPVRGLELRSLALTLLRRHGPQRLRDLHALIHLYGYCIDDRRPVQRLGDAMAYELRQGRVERLERGVYGPLEPHPGPARYAPPPTSLGGPLPWDRPVTDPGPPHLDPALAADPELWSGGAWPTDQDRPADAAGPESDPAEDDPPDLPVPAPAEDDPPDRPVPAPAAEERPAATPPEWLGDDSSANRRPESQGDPTRRWEPPP